MKSYDIPSLGYSDAANSGPKRLIEWRKTQGFPKQVDLAKHLTELIKKEHPSGAMPRGASIYQADVSRAEQGFPGPFQKVVKAVCHYHDLPDSFFGEPPQSPLSEILTVREATAKYEKTVSVELLETKSALIEAQAKLIHQLEVISALHKEVLALRLEVAELRRPTNGD